jgi:hypothetical protein
LPSVIVSCRWMRRRCNRHGRAACAAGFPGWCGGFTTVRVVRAGASTAPRAHPDGTRRASNGPEQTSSRRTSCAWPT